VASLGGIFGEGSAAQQFLLWNVASQVVGAVLDPAFREVAYQVNAKLPNVILTPDLLSDFVVRGIIDEPTAAGIAAQSGTNSENFTRMVEGSGEPPGLDFLLEAWRRGFIGFGGVGPGQATVANAIATSRVYTYWTDVIEKMAYVPISVADAVDAAVENQISKADASTIAGYSGIKPDDFTILFNTRGNPPAPTELMTMVNRGFIGLDGTGPTSTSFAQGIAEGATKDKWGPLLAELRVNIPSLYYLNELAEAGTLTATQVQAYYQDLGIPQEIASALAAQAASGKTAKVKELTESQILSSYQDGFISETQATAFLEALGYTATEVTFLLEVQNFQVALAAYNAQAKKVGAYFVAQKATAAETLDALSQLGMPSAQANKLITEWTLQQGMTVKLLSATEIVDAWYIGVMSQAKAQQELQNLGYSALDAFTLLCIKAKVILTNGPPGAPEPPVTGTP
jgi:hypothetical protein